MANSQTPAHSRYAARRPPLPLARDISLGNHDFQKAMVDCKYVGKHTAWGTWDGQHAGYFHLQINLHQPAGYDLSSANIYLSFLADDENAASPHKPIAVDVYPKRLKGQSRYRHSTRSTSFNPNANAAGFASFEIGSRQTGLDWTKQYHWQLKSSTLPDKIDRTLYTRVGWTWEANEFSEQSEESDFHTALFFCHHRVPFKTSVTIDGRFAKGFKRYLFRHKKSRPQIREFVPGSGTHDFCTKLDQIRAAVSKANHTTIPSEPPFREPLAEEPEASIPQITTDPTPTAADVALESMNTIETVAQGVTV